MTRASKRDVPRTAADEAADDNLNPRPHATVKTWPPAMGAGQPSHALPSSAGRPSRVIPKIEAEDREPDERLRSALGWYGFESWCAANGFRPLANTSQTVATVALYMTYLATTGRSLAIIARALLRMRDGRT